jgi:hypothetical protein
MKDALAMDRAAMVGFALAVGFAAIPVTPDEAVTHG